MYYMVARLVRDSKTVGMRVVEKGGKFKIKDLSLEEVKNNINEIENVKLLNNTLKVIHGNANSYSKVDIDSGKCLTKQKAVTVLFRDYADKEKYIIADETGFIMKIGLYEIVVLYKLSNCNIINNEDDSEYRIIGKNHTIQIQMTDKQMEAEKYKRRCSILGMVNTVIDARDKNDIILKQMKDNIENYVVPDFVNYIDKKCFESNRALKHIKIPKSVNMIGDGAFSKTYLKELVIPDEVIIIGEDLCEECSFLEKLVVGSGIKKIPKFAFSTCEKLKELTIKGDLESADLSFCGCKSLENVEISCERLLSNVFDDCANLKKITIKNLESIGPSCFEYCVKLQEIDMGNNVEVLDRNAFRHCESLRYIKLSESLKEIGSRCFHNCSNLEKIEIPKKVYKVGALCFSGCKNLESIKLNEGLEIIGSYCFKNCEKIKSITIPKSVREIGKDVFNGCNRLEHVKLPHGLDLNNCEWNLEIERY